MGLRRWMMMMTAAMQGGAAQTQIQKILATEPIAFWPGNEATGTTILELVAGNNGSYPTKNILLKNKLGPDGLGSARYAPQLGYGNLYSANLNTIFDRTEGEIQVSLRVNAIGAYTDGVSRVGLRIAASTQNQIYIGKLNTDNAFRIEWKGNNVTRGVTVSSFTNLDWFTVNMRWSQTANEIAFYIDNVQQGSTLTYAAWAALALASDACNIGTFTTATQGTWGGWAGRVVLWDRPLTDDERAITTDFTYIEPTPTLPGMDAADALVEDWRTDGDKTYVLQSHSSVTNPVIDETHVPLSVLPPGSTRTYVADPYIVKDGSTYYLFHEILFDNAETSQAETWIVYSTSADGLAWTFGGLVFQTSDTGSPNMSSPYVFKVEDQWYMIPDLEARYIDLYKADTFPSSWSLVEWLINPAYTLADWVIFQHGGHWWLTGQHLINTDQRLFYSEKLIGGVWTEHPSSPILTGAANSRSVGRPILWSDGDIDLFVMDAVTIYGNKVRAYRITALDTTTITLAETAASPVLDESGSGWNSHGMHALDRVSPTLSLVDGRTAAKFSIGIFEDVP